MPVSSVNKEYHAACEKWDLVRRIVDNNATKYIRCVDKNDPVRSKQYRDDAILTNFTRLTKIGLTGLVFRKPSTIKLAPGLEYLLADATGYEFGLEQLAQQIIGEVLTTGRYGVLVDYPPDGQESFARLRPYTAENIINWQYKEFGSEYKLTLLVLKEDICVDTDDPFVPLETVQYRVLRLSDDGIYYQQLYNAEEELVFSVTPTDYNGSPLSEIPFKFIGSENNDACIDSIPLYDLAVVNLGHYRNSADLEETSFICGQVVPYLNTGDTDQASFEQANPGGILIGSRKAIVGGTGGDFKFVQALPNVLPRELMKDKQEQAAAIGARLIAPAGGRETAEAARIRYGAQNSALYVVTKNVSLALEELLEIVSYFMLEVPVTSTFYLNDQFYEDSADANVIAQEILLMDRGALTVAEMRQKLKDVGELADDAEVDLDPNTIVNPLTGISDNVPEE